MAVISKWVDKISRPRNAVFWPHGYLGERSRITENYLPDRGHETWYSNNNLIPHTLNMGKDHAIAVRIWESRFRISSRGMGPRIVICKVIFTFRFGQWPLEETGEGRGGCNLQPDEVSTLSLHLNNTRWLPIIRESLAVLVCPMSSRTFPSSLLRQSCSKLFLMIPFAGCS